MASDSSSEDSEPVHNDENYVLYRRKRRRRWLQGEPVKRSTRQRWDKLGINVQSDSSGSSSETVQGSDTTEADSSNGSVSPARHQGDNLDHHDDYEGHQEDNEHHEERELAGVQDAPQGDASDDDSSSTSSSTSHSSYESHRDNREEINLNPDGLEAMNEKLYTDANVTKGEAVCMFLDLFTKHHLTKTCTKDLVKFLHKILPIGNTFPRSYYFLEKEIDPFIPPNSSVIHHVCHGCGVYITEDARNVEHCEICESTQKQTFLELPLEGQIRYLFEKRNLANAIDCYSSRDTSDIVNGEEYKLKKQLIPGKYDLCLLWNTDGVKPHKNTKHKLWPVMYSICEVAPQWRPFYSLVTGIWYSEQTPNLNSFLQPFCRSLQKLADVGVDWIHPVSKETIVSKVIAPVLSVDAPARAMVQNVHYYSGAYSCNTCEIPGVQLKLGRRSSKRIFPFPEFPNTLRTKERMEEQAQEAMENGTIVMGVKGISILSVIPYCDSSKSVILEYMHLLLLGCVRQFFEMWFKDTKKEWYLGKHASAITTFLQSVKITFEINRLPNSVDKYKLNKAAAWKAWLLFISVPALHGRMKEEYFQHWLLLVNASYLLLQDCVSDNDIHLAEQQLTLFVKQIETLYDDCAFTYNVHGLLHLGLMVRRWGALWATSAFPFESLNGYLTRILHGTRNISSELANTLSIANAGRTLQFMLKQDNSPIFQNFKPPCLMTPLTSVDFSAAEKAALNNAFGEDNQVTFYARAQIKCKIITSQEYKAEKAADNKNVCFKVNNEEKYGLVRCFLKKGNELFALIEDFDIQHDRKFRNEETNTVLKHIIPFLNTDTYFVVSLSDILFKIFRVHNYVSIYPNHYEIIL